jgi:hypothetical protein
MEKQKNSFRKTLFNIWCWLVTFWDNLFQNVTTDKSGCLYIRHEKGVLILQPISLSKKNLDSEENLRIGKIIQKRLLGKFKYNLSIENSCVVIPGESGTVKLFMYSIEKGWYLPDRNNHEDIRSMLRLSELSSKNNTNINFFYTEII